jgi:hypothetical protein
MSNQSNRKSYNVFIPFIRLGVTEEDVRRVFSKKQLGQVSCIDMHEKKIKTNTGRLVSANHHYAFLTVTPSQSEAGKNFAQNIESGHITNILHTDSDVTARWAVKPHLSVKSRTERGFTLLPSTEKLPVCEVVAAVEVSEIHPDTLEYSTDEDDSDLPEWMEDGESEFVSFSNLHFDNSIVTHAEVDDDPDNISIIRNMCAEFSMETVCDSVFDCPAEQNDILSDYQLMEADIRQAQQQFREYNMWESITIM